MKKLSKRMLLSSIVLSGTQIVSTSLGLSLFQIILFPTLIVCIICLFKNNRVYITSSLLFSCIFLLSSFIAWRNSIYPTWAQSYLLLGILASLLYLFIPMYFEKEDIGSLLKALIRSQYFTIALSIYSAWCFYIQGAIPDKIELGLGCFIEIEQGVLVRAQAAGHVRLTLPYATPPILSVVMALCIVILVIDTQLYNKVIRMFLIVTFTLILILTGSRTGVVAILLFFMVYIIEFIARRSKIKMRNILVFLIAFMVVIFAGIKGLGIEYFQKFIYRFLVMLDFEYLMESGHITIPLDGLLLWTSSVKSFLIGIGFGSSYFTRGYFIKELPPYFLNSYVTWVAERGIMGLILIGILIVTLFRCERKCHVQHNKAVTAALTVSLFSALFYETFICYFVIYIFAISFVVLKDRKGKNVYNISDCSDL